MAAASSSRSAVKLTGISVCSPRLAQGPPRRAGWRMDVVMRMPLGMIVGMAMNRAVSMDVVMVMVVGFPAPACPGSRSLGVRVIAAAFLAHSATPLACSASLGQFFRRMDVVMRMPLRMIVGMAMNRAVGMDVVVVMGFPAPALL